MKTARGTATALYLYGITQPPIGAAATAEGVDGTAPVEPVVCAGLLCWVSRVSRTEFADRLAANMEDLQWLASASVRHQRVVSEIARHAAVLPARFGTVFLSQQSLEKDVGKRKRALLEAFKRVADADEWGVKVFTTRSAAPPVKARSGREYLQRKAALLQERPSPQLAAEVKTFASELRRIARARTVGGKVSAGQRNLEWQGSFLLPRTRRKALERILRRFAARWGESRRIECSGPWPPYSFVFANSAHD